MSLPIQVREKYLRRFDQLIADGKAIHAAIETVHGQYDPNYCSSETGNRRPDKHVVDWTSFVRWRTNALTLMDQIIPKQSAHRNAVRLIGNIQNKKDSLEWGISFLTGIKDDFEHGILDDLSLQVEAEIAGDYMGQAEQLLTEGQPGKFDHVPAAVLAGAVLEKALRALCVKQVPPIDILNHKGEQKTMTPLIEELKRANVILETKAKQLRGYAGIRNDAAHGDFDKFSRHDVE